MRETVRKSWRGVLLCLCIAIPAWMLGSIKTWCKWFNIPLEGALKQVNGVTGIIGGAVLAILAGMLIAVFFKKRGPYEAGIKFTSKKVLQWAVVLLGFGMNLGEVARTGLESLPIILSTIATSLILAFVLCRVMKIPSRIATLVGVGSSICGGSAIAATAPVIGADDEEVAQAISVIFFFNVLAALIFPALGNALGFAHEATGFGIFAGTAVNDTSSVTACASTWDSMWGLGAETLNKATTVKLTRTLAIIPITVVLSVLQSRKGREQGKLNLKKIVPMFILYFVAASLITTVCMSLGVSKDVFTPFKELSKFMIVLAMAAIGLSTDIVKLIRTGGKPLALGACCWAGITAVSLMLQKVMGLW